MHRRHVHTEKGVTTTAGTRTKYTRIVRGLSESLRLSQSRITIENPQSLRSTGRNDHRSEETPYQRKMSIVLKKLHGWQRKIAITR